MFDGAGDPVQIDGVVPGAFDGGWFGLHAVKRAIGTANGTNTAAATLRLVAGLTIEKD
jgi:hypothetical protein